jgi:hypothetical protein
LAAVAARPLGRAAAAGSVVAEVVRALMPVPALVGRAVLAVVAGAESRLEVAARSAAAGVEALAWPPTEAAGPRWEAHISFRQVEG